MLLVDREDLEGVAAHPEGAAGEGEVVAGVLDLHEPPQHVVAVHLVADLEPEHPVDVLLRGAEAVDARDRRDHDHVAPGEQRVGRRVTQPLDLLVDRGVLLDVGVRLRDVGLGLVVVVVGDEVLDGVLGEQLAQLVGELGGERLVGLHHQDRALHLLRHPGHRGGLAGAGGAEEHDVLHATLDPLGDLRDRGRLVARRLVVGLHVERRDTTLEIGDWTHATSVRASTDISLGRRREPVSAGPSRRRRVSKPGETRGGGDPVCDRGFETLAGARSSTSGNTLAPTAVRLCLDDLVQRRHHPLINTQPPGGAAGQAGAVRDLRDPAAGRDRDERWSTPTAGAARSRSRSPRGPPSRRRSATAP